MLGAVAKASGSHIRRFAARDSMAGFLLGALQLRVIALDACAARERRRVMQPTRMSGLAGTFSFSFAR